MGKEEQKEEREVLESIFPDEITDTSETEYRIAIALDVPGAEDNEDEEVQPIIVLRVAYPEDYPDVAPGLDIGAPPNAPKYKHLDVIEDKPLLLDSLQSTIDENIGMPMIFTLVSTLKDSAELLISERQQATQALKDAEAAKAEEEENRKFHGTAVTRETFLEWSGRFRQEMQDEEKRKHDEKEAEDKRKRVVKEERKLTGRQLWERGIAGKGEEEEALDASGLNLDEKD